MLNINTDGISEMSKFHNLGDHFAPCGTPEKISFLLDDLPPDFFTKLSKLKRHVNVESINAAVALRQALQRATPVDENLFGSIHHVCLNIPISAPYGLI